MKTPLISVIMPVYNAEIYLKESLKSVLNQTFEDFELICIDDGSKDKSLSILKGIKDKRLRVIHQENQGVSATRNKGIKEARGEYLTFIDSDDLWHPRFLEIMTSAAKRTKALVTGCGYQKIKTTPQDFSKQQLKNQEVIQDRPFLRYLTRKLGTHAMVWGKLYHKSIFKKLSFDPILHYAEDTHFSIQLFSGLKTITCLKEPLYLYRLSENSLTRSGLKPEIVENRLISFRKLIDYFDKNKLGFREDWLIRRKLAKRYFRSVCILPWKKGRDDARQVWEKYVPIAQKDIRDKKMNLNNLNLYYRFLFWLWRHRYWRILKIFL